MCVYVYVSVYFFRSALLKAYGFSNFTIKFIIKRLQLENNLVGMRYIKS